MKVHIELGCRLDAVGWNRRHVQGDVPDSMPFGLQHLLNLGHDVSIRTAPSYRTPVKQLSSAVSKIVGADLQIVESYGDGKARRHADVLLAWDDQRSIPAGLRHVQRGGPPVVARMGELIESSQWRKRLAKRLVPAGLSGIDLFVASTSVHADALNRRWNIDSSAIGVVTPGVDVDFWMPQGNYEPAGSIVDAIQGQYSDHESFDAAVSQLGLVSRAVRSSDCVASVGAASARASFIGASAVVVSALPNAHGAGARELLSAMACACPVVVVDTGGLSELVQNEYNALVVPPKDPARLSQAIADVLANPGEAEVLGKNARESVLDSYTSQHMCERLDTALRLVG
jgi:hypothetical protein